MMLRVTAAFLVLCATTTLPLHASAQTYTTLYTFCEAAPCPDGEWPESGLIQAADGDLYGTTYLGGANNLGTIYKITTSGTFTTVASMFSPNAYSVSGLIQVIDGAFYGATPTTIFKLTPDGALSTLTTNAGSWASLVQGEDGDLYGTLMYGPGNCVLYAIYGCGTIFKVTRSGELTTLYDFCSRNTIETLCTDGFDAYYAGVILGTNGDMYGTTAFGGNNAGICYQGGGAFAGCGTVYRLTPDGSLTTMYRFDGYDGAIPLAGVIEGNDGNFYGTTSGIEDNGNGTVFKFAKGTLTTLYNFCQLPNCADGSEPWAGLIQATDGNFYGTTPGTIFKITPDGTLTTLYSVGGTTGLIQATDGNLYGTTGGTIFRLSVGLGPFVRTQNTYGKVGARVNILGTNLTGTTNVTFHGTPATFTVASATEIITTVPTGATNGFVEIETPSGTLRSNVVFRVQP
jgi:uncharacterized repeat protein (TIGR03803 family)